MRTLESAQNAIIQAEQTEKEKIKKAIKEQKELEQEKKRIIKEQERQKLKDRKEKGITKDGNIICENCKNEIDRIYISGTYSEVGMLGDNGDIADWCDMDTDANNYECPECGANVDDQINW